MIEELGNITLLALVDAINPCTLAIQSLLLASLLITRGKKQAIIGGFLFTLTIYVMYFLYGLGVLKALGYLTLSNLSRIIFSFLVGLMALLEFKAFFRYSPGFSSMEMPLKFRPIAQKYIRNISSLYMVIPVAVFCSLFLLPCSSGPYLSALIIMNNLAKKIIYMLYYNLIFVTPMILITLLVSFGMMPQSVIVWREKNVRYLHLIAGILLLIVLILVWWGI